MTRISAPARLTAPKPTRGAAPSRSSPDVLYEPGRGLADALGLFSIGLGLWEALAPRSVAETTGAQLPEGLIRAFGLREVLCGISILSNARPAGSVGARVAGDAMDLAALASALRDASAEQRKRIASSAAAVFGVTVLDLICCLQLSAAAALEG